MADENKPVPGGIYRDSVSGVFKVLAVGRIHEVPGMVLQVGGELCVYKKQAWDILFQSPVLISVDQVCTSRKGSGLHHGIWCEVIQRGQSISVYPVQGDRECHNQTMMH